MKIAIFVGGLPPQHLGGTEVATYNIARHLTKRGHEVHVITSLDKGLPKESLEQGFNVHRIGWRKVRFIGVISFWLKILLVLKKIKPDIVHMQNISIGTYGILAKKILKRPYVVWGQGSDVYLPWRFKKTISRLVLQNADAAIALTEDMKKKMQGIYSREVSVIPNGIELGSFAGISHLESRAELQIKEEERIITFVGSLRPVKGVRFLIQAMAIINREVEGARLMVVGDGPDREDLENLTKELDLVSSVTFVGKVTNERVPIHMAASDVFVLPSLSEGFGIVILEAMACGVPIIASRVGGLPEIVKDGQNGFLVQPQKPEEIAEKILLLLEDDELRERISRNNKEKASKYDWDSIVEKLISVYSEISTH